MSRGDALDFRRPGHDAVDYGVAGTGGHRPRNGRRHDDTDTAMRIGQLADTVGVNTKTVRYYESIGLMPEPGRTDSGYRDYGADALERLQFIRDAQASGLTLAEIQSILELKDAGEGTCEHTRRLLARHLDDIDDQIARLEQARIRLRELHTLADTLDPTDCTDPHRCQVIDEHLGH